MLDRGLFAFHLPELDRDRIDPRLALKQRVSPHLSTPTEENSLIRDVFAAQSGGRELGIFRDRIQRLLQIFKQHDVMEQTLHQCLERARRAHFISGPADRMLRQIFRSRTIAMVDSFENECGLTQLLFIQIRNDFRCARVVAQNQRMQISAQRSFDRRDEFMRNVELGRQRASKFKLFTLQQRLRTLRQSFAFLIELTQNFVTRFFFGDGSVDCG